MTFYITLKRMVNVRIPNESANFEQVLDHQVVKRQAACWCQKFECKQLFRERLYLGIIWNIREIIYIYIYIYTEWPKKMYTLFTHQ